MKRNRRELGWLLGFCAVGAALIGVVRTDLVAVEEDVMNKHDVGFLPPPQQVVTMSLGYRHALADVLWAHLLVAQGLRLNERRRLDTLISLYDVINELDPTFRTPYIMADALITFNVIPSTKDNAHIDKTLPYEDIVKAREIMERGVRALPKDPEIWLTLGQFLSYIAPASYLEDRPEEAERWRREGVTYLERAVELSGGNSSVSWQAIGGAAILRDAGELEASIRFYERAYAITDDDELRDAITARLDVLRKRRDQEVSKLDATQSAAIEARLRQSAAYRRRTEAARAWTELELPHIERSTFDVLGPPPSPAACAGPSQDAACATDWRVWADRFNAESE